MGRIKLNAIVHPRVIRIAIFLVLLFCALLSGLDSRKLSVFPDNLAPLYQDWDFRIRSARLSGDIAALERQQLWLIKNRPLDLSVRWQLAELYASCGLTNKLKTATSEYRKLLNRSQPWQWNSWNLWFQAAKSYDLEGEDEQALRLYRKSLAYGARAYAYNRIMELELKRGHFPEALEACKRWVQLGKFRTAQSERLLGQCHARSGLQDKAQAAFLRALEANPLDLAALEALAKTGITETTLIRQAVKAVAKNGYNLDYLNNVIETCIRADRSAAARLVVQALSNWFTPKRSLYWCLAAARANKAAGDYLDAALYFRQARLWRSTAPASERAYYLEREIRLLLRAGKIPEALTLYKEQGALLGNEARICIELETMRTTNAPAPLEEALLVSHAAGEKGDWANLTPAFLEKVSLILEPPEIQETLVRLWRLCLSRHADPVSLYAAGKFFLSRGLPAEALDRLQRAGAGMRSLGLLSVEIEGAARLLGLSEEASWHNARARYLLGHERYNNERSLLVQRLHRAGRGPLP